MVVVKFSDGVEHSSYLLWLACEEKIACEHPDELFKIMLFALFEHDLGVGCKELSWGGIVWCH